MGERPLRAGDGLFKSPIGSFQDVLIHILPCRILSNHFSLRIKVASYGYLSRALRACSQSRLSCKLLSPLALPVSSFDGSHLSARTLPLPVLFGYAGAGDDCRAAPATSGSAHHSPTHYPAAGL